MTLEGSHNGVIIHDDLEDILFVFLESKIQPLSLAIKAEA